LVWAAVAVAARSTVRTHAAQAASRLCCSCRSIRGLQHVLAQGTALGLLPAEVQLFSKPLDQALVIETLRRAVAGG